MEIFTSSDFASVNQLVKILLFSDTFSLTHSFSESLTSVTPTTVSGDSRNHLVVARTDFSSPISVSADTFFFIGMSGESTNLGLYGLDSAPGPNVMGVVQNSVITGPEINLKRMAFRLHGYTAAVPDAGSSLALSAFGLLAIATFRRRFKS
ncbi:VPDSG-CTERM sorting domain-containing protein [Pelagicoccus sp. SDUM812005]|uniref:VPDSG-CTERM sorting domain-containing protein n=1 Tax=Pelagicoccus sp. SDUM812005 TaxID=3041257 RepID=UPI00280ECC27|nr:VPDSG-CTERM sorting domain-containing protein [Pelagicoccus sp. SDUM812005]MDQ8183002.1 VPDSG-CTERM sorting domain-containing protein [Pelagicoccus sp. SDUM812005]